MATQKDTLKSGALEALSKVKDAEERARAIVREAQKQTVPQIIHEAAAAAEKLKQDSFGRAKRDAESRKQAIIAQALEEASGIRAQAEAELVLLRQRAAANLPGAVKRAAARIRELLGGGSV
ncbi:MAG: hypothetical protein AB1715_10040 [Acidobacteriota bacterium]